MSELGNAAQTQAEPSVVGVPPPRLSVMHLMLWTLCSAVHFALLRAIDAMQSDLGMGSVAMIQQTSDLIRSMIAGAAITGAIVLVSARLRTGPPLLRHPGYWLLFIAAITALAILLLGFSLLFASDRLYGGNSDFLFGVVYLLPPIGFAFAAHCNPARHWRVLFFALLLVALSQSAFYFGVGLSHGKVGDWMAVLSVFPDWGYLMLATAMMFVSIVEIKTGPPRDWLHWTGVTTFLASSSVHLIKMFA